MFLSRLVVVVVVVFVIVIVIVIVIAFGLYILYLPTLHHWYMADCERRGIPRKQVAEKVRVEGCHLVFLIDDDDCDDCDVH